MRRKDVNIRGEEGEEQENRTDPGQAGEVPGGPQNDAAQADPKARLRE